MDRVLRRDQKSLSEEWARDKPGRAAEVEASGRDKGKFGDHWCGRAAVTLAPGADTRQTLEIRGMLLNDPGGFAFVQGGRTWRSEIVVLAPWDVDGRITS